MKKTFRRTLTVTLAVLLVLSVTAVPAFAASSLDKYNVIAKGTVQNDAPLEFAKDKVVTLKEGQSLFIMFDPVGKAKIFDQSGDAIGPNYSVASPSGRVWEYNATTGVSSKQGGATGTGMRYVCTINEVDVAIGEVVNDSYFDNVMNNLQDMEFGTPDAYVAGAGIPADNGWQPKAPYAQWSGILGIWGLAQTGHLELEGKNYAICVGFEIVAPEDGDYVVNSTCSTNPGGDATVYLLTSKLDAGTTDPTDAPTTKPDGNTNPDTGDMGIAFSLAALFAASGSVVLLKKRNAR